MTDIKTAKKILKSELSKKGISHESLALLLQKQGVNETKSSIDSKISRGTFSADFLLSCLAALDCKSIELPAESQLAVKETATTYNMTVSQHKTLRFIDLFAGMGGTRIGFEHACTAANLQSTCLFTSEIKQYAIDIYQHNFQNAVVHGDITQIDGQALPDFDYLLGGFPCQAFSMAGKKEGFYDTRGTLFFDIARILKDKQPTGFLLENVEGLVTHDKQDRTAKIGNTLRTVLAVLEELGYYVNWRVLDAKHFGIPQERKRIYIVGHKRQMISLDDFPKVHKTFADIKQTGLTSLNTQFVQRLLALYSPEQLAGKAIKDKRGGEDNIHSWDLELKGALNTRQKEIMNTLLRERRKKKWAEIKGIEWMDGMPLTLDEIHSFYSCIDKNALHELLEDMVAKSYLRFEHPKDLVTLSNGQRKREYAVHVAKGYNIVTGKLSFELNKILSEQGICPTIVATEANRIGVLDNGGIRRLSERECLRFFGFPEWYRSNIKPNELYDLVGNTVIVPIIEAIVARLIAAGR